MLHKALSQVLRRVSCAYKYFGAAQEQDFGFPGHSFFEVLPASSRCSAISCFMCRWGNKWINVGELLAKSTPLKVLFVCLFYESTCTFQASLNKAGLTFTYTQTHAADAHWLLVLLSEAQWGRSDASWYHLSSQGLLKRFFSFWKSKSII